MSTSNITAAGRAVTEGLFGPVAPLVRSSTEEEVVRLAHDTRDEPRPAADCASGTAWATRVVDAGRVGVRQGGRAGKGVVGHGGTNRLACGR